MCSWCIWCMSYLVAQDTSSCPSSAPAAMTVESGGTDQLAGSRGRSRALPLGLRGSAWRPVQSTDRVSPRARCDKFQFHALATRAAETHLPSSLGFTASGGDLIAGERIYVTYPTRRRDRAPRGPSVVGGFLLPQGTRNFRSRRWRRPLARLRRLDGAARTWRR